MALWNTHMEPSHILSQVKSGITSIIICFRFVSWRVKLKRNRDAVLKRWKVSANMKEEWRNWLIRYSIKQKYVCIGMINGSVNELHFFWCRLKKIRRILSDCKTLWTNFKWKSRPTRDRMKILWVIWKFDERCETKYSGYDDPCCFFDRRNKPTVTWSGTGRCSMSWRKPRRELT